MSSKIEVKSRVILKFTLSTFVLMFLVVPVMVQAQNVTSSSLLNAFKTYISKPIPVEIK